MEDAKIPNGAFRPNRLNRAAVATNLLSLGMIEMEDRIRANHPQAEDALAIALAYLEHNRAFAHISIYRQLLARQFERTLNQFRQVQADRRATEERQLDKAAKILKMHKANNPNESAPYNPADDGFRLFERRNRDLHPPRPQ